MSNPVFDMLGEKTKNIGKPRELLVVNHGLPLELEENFEITGDTEIDDFLQAKAKELLGVQAKASIEIGEILEAVYKKLAGDNHHNGTYSTWIEKTGFTRVTALRHRRRYEMFNIVKSNKGKAFIATLPVRVIDSIYRYDDFSGIMTIIDEGITRNELESMIVDTIINEVEILPYNSKETEKVFKNISKMFKSVSLEKVSDENVNSFEKDMKKIEKIISKWMQEEG